MKNPCLPEALADPKIGCGLASRGLKPGATEPPYTGGTLAEFSRDSPSAGALANFWPVTLVKGGATISDFSRALFPILSVARRA